METTLAPVEEKSPRPVTLPGFGRPLMDHEMVINMGPQHPSTHGVLRLELVVDGEIVVDVIPHIGYLHRCFEKHCEHMTNYQQVIPYCDRMDYVAAMNNDFGYAVACEKLLKIKVPERVEYIRVIMAELQRIASHLIAIGTYGMDIGAFTPFLYCFRDRERILDIFEQTCGARLLYNYIWIGGLSHDVPPTSSKRSGTSARISVRTSRRSTIFSRITRSSSSEPRTSVFCRQMLQSTTGQADRSFADRE